MTDNYADDSTVRQLLCAMRIGFPGVDLKARASEEVEREDRPASEKELKDACVALARFGARITTHLDALTSPSLADISESKGNEEPCDEKDGVDPEKEAAEKDFEEKSKRDGESSDCNSSSNSASNPDKADEEPVAVDNKIDAVENQTAEKKKELEEDKKADEKKEAAEKDFEEKNKAEKAFSGNSSERENSADPKGEENFVVGTGEKVEDAHVGVEIGANLAKEAAEKEKEPEEDKKAGREKNAAEKDDKKSKAGESFDGSASSENSADKPYVDGSHEKVAAAHVDVEIGATLKKEAAENKDKKADGKKKGGDYSTSSVSASSADKKGNNEKRRASSGRLLSSKQGKASAADVNSKPAAKSSSRNHSNPKALGANNTVGSRVPKAEVPKETANKRNEAKKEQTARPGSGLGKGDKVLNASKIGKSKVKPDAPVLTFPAFLAPPPVPAATPPPVPATPPPPVPATPPPPVPATPPPAVPATPPRAPLRCICNRNTSKHRAGSRVPASPDSSIGSGYRCDLCGAAAVSP